MASQENNSTFNSLVRDLFQLGVYKRNQGRVTRQVTFAALALIVLLGAWRLNAFLVGQSLTVQYAVPGVVLAVGLWVSFRVVNWPVFADFLISVEAEMNKVSWPTRSELFRSSAVVIVTIFGLAALLFGYDLLWQIALKSIGVLGGG